MINIENAELEKIIIHYVGNKSREEGCQFSESVATPSARLKQLLLQHYLLPLSEAKSPSIFFHESDLGLNAMAQFSRAIFNTPAEFEKISEQIAKHLYSVLEHPNIVGGEFMVMLFSGLKIKGQESQALAVLKVEGKASFLDIHNENGTLELVDKEGIALSEIQKGALIFEAENCVLAIDIFKKHTKYWLDDFLKIQPMQTEEATLKAGRDLLRGVTQRIASPDEHLEFNHTLGDYLESREEVRFEDLEALARPYVAPEAYSELYTKAEERAGFPIRQDYAMPTSEFRQEARKVMRTTRIVEGVNLVVSDEDTYLNKIELEEREGGVRAIIEFDIYKDEE